MSVVKKATIASVSAGILVIAGLAYGVWQRDTQLVTFLAGAAVGFLFKERVTENT